MILLMNVYWYVDSPLVSGTVGMLLEVGVWALVVGIAVVTVVEDKFGVIVSEGKGQDVM